MVVNQTAELRYASDFLRADELANTVIERSPGLRPSIVTAPAVDGRPPEFASIIFSIDYGDRLIDWRIHQEVVRLAIATAGLTDRFKPLA